MPTALTYQTYIQELQVLCQFNQNDPNFSANISSAINYAEDRINRELDLLNTVTTNSNLTLTASQCSLDATSVNMNVIEQVNVITPSSTTNPNLGQRNPCTFVTKEWLDMSYGSSSTKSLPNYWSRLNYTTLLFGPWPDANYTVELVGTVFPTTLSQANSTTWISTYVPDLFLAASMIWMSGFMRNFGSQADDPRMSQSWEQQYETLKNSAMVEDARRKFQSQGWSAKLPEQATTPRT